MPEQRHLKLHAPTLAGDQELFVARIHGVEAISQPFLYEVILQAKSDDVDFDQVLGHEMSIGIELPSGEERFIHGYVASFALIGADGDFSEYRAQLRPHLWRLTRASDCRIFQGDTVPEIVQSILKQHLVKDVEESTGQSNRGPFLAWDYCVQYRETDFAFVSRLLEHEGIHYYFKHEKNRHLLVLADSNTTHQPVPGYETLENRRAYDARLRQYERVWDWSMTRSVLPGRLVATDYDFKSPYLELRNQSGSEVKRSHPKAVDGDYELYDHLETVVQQVGYTPTMVEQYARIRSEAVHANYEVVTAQTDARGLCTGATFAVKDGPKRTEGHTFMVLRTDITAANNRRASGDGESPELVYACRFEAIDTQNPYRPARVTPKPYIAGVQSATVVGGNGTPYWTNDHGQVRVKFRWDRTEKKDASCSCWMRVAQSSAGANWGSLFLPHIGHEVLVAFLEGDPDRPVIVGSLYNGKNKLPVECPPNGYKTVIRDVAGNQIVMDATPGEESVMIASPKNHAIFTVGKQGQEQVTKTNSTTMTDNGKNVVLQEREDVTLGNQWELTRGLAFAVKTGGSLGITHALDLSASLSLSATMKLGASAEFAVSNSFSYTIGREYKITKGTYTRVSKDNASLESQATAFVCGGKNDNTMMASNDTELALTFDDSGSGRAAKIDAGHAKARNWAIGVGVCSAALGGWAGWSDWAVATGSGPAHDRYAATKQKDDILGRYNELSDQEKTAAGVTLAGITALAGSMVAQKAPASPEHKSPSAKIVLRKDLVRLYAGKKEDTELTLSKQTGALLGAQRSIMIESEKAGVRVAAKAEIVLKSDAMVRVDAILKHPNMLVLK